MTHDVASLFSFIFARNNLLLVQEENALLTCCQNFQEKFSDVDFVKMAIELKRFVLILLENESLNTAHDLLNCLLKTRFFEVCLNVFIALRIVLTCLVTVASAEQSFSKLKLVETFNCMVDCRLSSLAMLSIESTGTCTRSLDYDAVIRALANKEVCSRPF